MRDRTGTSSGRCRDAAGNGQICVMPEVWFEAWGSGILEFMGAKAAQSHTVEGFLLGYGTCEVCSVRVKT